MPEKIAYSIKEFADVSGLSKSSIYKLLMSDKLPSIWLGGKRRIPAQEGQRMLREARQDKFKPMKVPSARRA
jgi:excisionase family DNA binding protein